VFRRILYGTQEILEICCTTVTNGTWEIQTQLKSAVLLLIHVSCIVPEPDPRGSGSETISCTGSYNFTGIAHLRKLLIETLQSHMKPL